MLLVVVGAGASYDSVPSRDPGRSDSPLPEVRPPLADQLFEPRPIFEDAQRLLPQVMQIAGSLLRRQSGMSVEDVLAEYAEQVDVYPHRATQLALVRFYLQAIIARCESAWCLNNQVATNMMTLIDRIEYFRGSRERPVIVTFNYDRLIEDALVNRGQSYTSMNDYIPNNGVPVIKLHGSVDWVRRIASANRFPWSSAPGWTLATEIANHILSLPAPGPIERMVGIPSSLVEGFLAMPAIAIPVKEKSEFECPDSHVEFLRGLVKEIKTILTVGWRGGERHFLKLLRDSGLKKFDAMCVAAGTRAAEETVQNLQLMGVPFDVDTYNNGFTQFLAERKADDILDKTWR